MPILSFNTSYCWRQHCNLIAAIFALSETINDVGPGVGKGRQIASLVFENILRGRTKVSLLSACLPALTECGSSC